MNVRSSRIVLEVEVHLINYLLSMGKCVVSEGSGEYIELSVDTIELGKALQIALMFELYF